MSEPFTDFERNPGADTGVMWDNFVTAVAVYVCTNEDAFDVSVQDVAEAFNTTPELVREAVDEHPWLTRSGDDHPLQDLIESEGE